MRFCSCGQPARDQAYLCDQCVHTLSRNIGDLPFYVRELQITATRQNRQAGYRVGSRSAEKPLPWDETASQTAEALTVLLYHWTKIIVEAVGCPWPLGTDAMIRFLARQVEWARFDQRGQRMAADLAGMVGRMRDKIDRPADWYAGPCSTTTHVLDVVQTHDGAISLQPAAETTCMNSLYARPESKIITCTVCGTRRPAVQRREWLVAQVEDSLLPLRMLVDALPTLTGRRLEWDTVRRWRIRGTLVPRGLSAGGEELFRGGDVLNLARQATRRIVRRVATISDTL